VTSILDNLRQHALALVALVCSLLAMAGSSYAAFTISGSQIRNHTINPVKMNPRFVNGQVRAWAIVSSDGKVLEGKGGPRAGMAFGVPSGYIIRWGVKVGRCATEATVDEYASPRTEQIVVPNGSPTSLTAGYAVAATAGRSNATDVQTFDQTGQPTPLGFDVAVIC
jgi:hypothetical protein